MKKLLLSTLVVLTMCFMTNAAMACGPDCKCGCKEGKPCNCQKVEAKCECGCEECLGGNCDKCLFENCEAKNCGCKQKAQSRCQKKSSCGIFKRNKKACPIEQ